MSDLIIRVGEERDLPELTAIYNHYVRETPVTFDVDPFTPEERREWFEHYADHGPYRLLVGLSEENVIGYTTSSQFRTKRAYDSSVETTIYLHPDHVARGHGRSLYDALFAELANEQVHRCVSGITLPNPASVALHESCGFRSVGVFPEIGHKLGRYWDVAWFWKEL